MFIINEWIIGCNGRSKALLDEDVLSVERKHVPLDGQLFVGRLLDVDHNLFVHAWPQFEALSVLVLWYGTVGYKESFRWIQISPQNQKISFLWWQLAYFSYASQNVQLRIHIILNGDSY